MSQGMEHRYGTLVWNTGMEHRYGTPVWNTGTEHWYGTPVWNTGMEHRYGTLGSVRPGGVSPHPLLESGEN